jgi:glycosyltransferase involved in cell wall biosynthesis
MSVMANNWARRDVDVTLLTLKPARADDYPLDSRVERLTLPPLKRMFGVKEVVGGTVKRVRLIREQIRRVGPDVVVSFIDMTNILVILAARGTGVPVVVSERVYPPAYTIHPLWRTLRRLLYRYAEAVVVQTEPAREWGHTIAAPSRVHVIPNPCSPPHPGEGDPDPWQAWPPARGASGRIAAVGRFSREKGFDLLVDAFDRLSERHPGWVLAVAGEGPERSVLEGRDRVWLPGRIDDPGSLLARADVFALPSRFEGFPNVLLEAMARGLAVVAADCPVGPAAIVRDGVDALFVPPEDVAALAHALDRLMSDAALRAELGSRAREVTERFSEDRVMAMWDALLHNVARVRAQA